MKNSHNAMLLWLLSDWEFHSNEQLSDIIWWRFWWYLHELKKHWCIFEKEQRKPNDKPYIEYWKLIFIPYELEIINGRIRGNVKKWPQEIKITKTIPQITYSQDKRNLLNRIIGKVFWN